MKFAVEDNFVMRLKDELGLHLSWCDRGCDCGAVPIRRWFIFFLGVIIGLAL